MPELARFVFRVPVFGWLLHDAIAGLPDAKYYFVANVAIALVALIYRFGYPFLITLAVCAAFLGLAMIVVLTAIDAFGRGSPKPTPAPARRRRN